MSEFFTGVITGAGIFLLTIYLSYMMIFNGLAMALGAFQ